MEPSAVAKIGKYEILETLGRGGMGVVYRAMDPRIGRMVAIKMMTAEVAADPDYLNRFYREAQSTGILQHPNIVVVHDLGDQDGVPYLVMEYLEGEALDKILARRRELSLPEKLGILIAVLNGLHYAHQRGVVHRDIKPANIMVLRDGGVKIVDFGIARLGNMQLTKTGNVVGTINYMSPEQINGIVVDGRSDVFSAGVVLFELLTLTLPFEGSDTTTTLMKILHEPPPPLKNFIVTPPELENVLRQALAKNRDERFQSAADFAFELTRIQEGLNREMVNDYLESAKRWMERDDFGKAKELLQQVLKVDTQQREACELMNRVQAEMQRRQRAQQLGQLRADAEDAMNSSRFDDALAIAEQALTVGPDPYWSALRDRAAEAVGRKNKFDAALKRAHTAYSNGDLELATRELEEAVKADPANEQVKALQAGLAKKVEERNRQQHVADALDVARKEVAARRFNPALEALKRAEATDPNNVEIQALRKMAVAGLEQETRRRDLDKASSEIENALKFGDVDGAWAKVNDALGRLSSEPSLMKLRAQIERQRDAADASKRIEDQMAAARKLLDEGRGSEALSALESASRAAVSDSRITSALAALREEANRLHHDHQRASYLQKARTAMDARRYAEAVRVLQEAAAALPADRDIADLLKFAREEAANSGEPVPEPTPPKSSRVSSETSIASWSPPAEDPRVIAPPEPKAVPLPPAPPRPTMPTPIPSAAAPGAAPAASAPAPAPRPPSPTVAMTPPSAPTVAASAPMPHPAPATAAPTAAKRSSPLPIIIVVVVLFLATGGYFAYQKFAAPAPVGTLEIYAVPWGMVKSVTPAKGGETRSLDQATPLSLELPAGEYRVVIDGPDGQEKTETVNINASHSHRMQPVFGQVNVEEIIREH